MPQMVCELLLERGDYILAEEYTYPSVIESVIIPKGYKPLGVQLDQDGILPESLLEVFEHWHANHCTLSISSTVASSESMPCSNFPAQLHVFCTSLPHELHHMTVRNMAHITATIVVALTQWKCTGNCGAQRDRATASACVVHSPHRPESHR